MLRKAELMILSVRIKGFLYILLADCLWGLSATAAKHLFNNQVSPFDLVQIRLLLSFLILLAYLAAFKPGLLRIGKKDIPYILNLGIFGFACVQFTYYYTISQTNVATAIFLQYLAPFFILTYGLLTRKDSVSPVKMLALGAATLGGLLMVKGTTGAGMAITLPGLAVGLASAAAFAFYTVYGKYGLQKYSPWTLMLWGMGVGGAAWAFYSPPWITFARYSTATDWLFFFYIAVFATILPFGFFFKGLGHLTPVVAGITSTMEPVLAAALAYLILGEALTVMQIAGCALILSAVTIIQIKPGSGEKTQENQ